MLLPDHIASQIAAGEVVERPSSVVKELVENSIDAGANKIVVSVEEGCRSIRVSDNGSGMEPEDAVLAFQRHATSKITSADQLWKLSSLGFRGEALPSIAAVSRVTCFTRTADNKAGTKVECADGALAAGETGSAAGTVIEVNDLFYNVPARLNFLKKATTELGHIQETVQSLAVSYPAIAFELFYEGEVKFATRGSGDLTRAALEAGHLYEEDSLINISASEADLGLGLEGRIASPTQFRGDRKGILTIVNSRPVRCQIAYKALDYAYADLIPRGRYPLAVLHLTLKPENLDVNIHPTKKEVKYSNGNEIYTFIHRQLTKALRTPVYSAGFSETGLPASRSATYESGLPAEGSPPTQSYVREKPASSSFFGMPPAHISEQQTFSKDLRYEPTAKERTDNQANRVQEAFRVTGQSGPALPADWRLIGYLHNSYFLIETSEGLLIIEQHIAHERVIYESLVTQAELAPAQADNLQRLIISCPLKLTAEQSAYLEEHLNVLNSFGFDFELENGAFQCVQVPVELAHRDYAKVVQEILQSLCESAQPNVKLEITKSLACQAAVKNGMPLSDAQIVKLLNDWLNTPRNETCPHGRPIKLAYSKKKLFELFHP